MQPETHRALCPPGQWVPGSWGQLVPQRPSSKSKVFQLLQLARASTPSTVSQGLPSWAVGSSVVQSRQQAGLTWPVQPPQQAAQPSAPWLLKLVLAQSVPPTTTPAGQWQHQSGSLQWLSLPTGATPVRPRGGAGRSTRGRRGLPLCGC